MLIEKFEDLVSLLKEHKYEIDIIKRDGYKFATVTGKNIRGGFSTKSDLVYHHVSNAFCADHIDCFDKWSKCPLRMTFPIDGDILIKYLEILRSEEGFDNSNSYDYLNNDLYPYKGESV